MLARSDYLAVPILEPTSQAIEVSQECYIINTALFFNYSVRIICCVCNISEHIWQAEIKKHVFILSASIDF